MNARAYRYVSGALFALIATAQASRAALALPVTLAGTTIPVWWSWIAAAFTGLLAIWAFRARE